jgi:hypothetical protein
LSGIGHWAGAAAPSPRPESLQTRQGRRGFTIDRCAIREKDSTAARGDVDLAASMNPVFYQIIHIVSVLVLTGFTFYAFAAAPETRKRVMMITGIASLLVLVAGFGLQAKLKLGWPGWLFVKIACWLALSALAGIGYRKRESVGALSLIATLAIIVAVVMVYTRPF